MALFDSTQELINFKDQEILVSIQGNYKSSINETINFDINNEKVLKFDQEGNRIYER